MEPNAKKEKKSGETCVWNQAMDEVLNDAYLHQHTLGNKSGNSMISKAMDSIVNELKQHFPNRPISREKIKDHMKHIKAKFDSCYDLFKNGLSGFAWDASKSMWIAKPEVWDRLIEAKPKAVEWRNKLILHYEKLSILFGKDRATGEHAQIADEIRARKAVGRNDHDSTIDEIDHLVSTNEVTLEGFNTFDVEFQSFASPKGPSNGQSHGATSTKKKQTTKGSEEYDSMSQIAKSIEKMVEVFAKCSSDLVNQQKNEAKDDIIWTQLEETCIEPELIPDVYFHLVGYSEALKCFNGIPIQRHKEMLPYIVPSYPPST